MNTRNDIKISFILPVYNVEKWLDNCLGSIYRQQLDSEEFEVICVNDGSSDNSLEILKKWAVVHNNLVIIDQKNKGMSSARNVGITYAKGQYIRFIDSDDYIADGVTRDPLKIAINNDLDILYTRTKRTTDNDVYGSIPSDVDLFDGVVLSGKEYF